MTVALCIICHERPAALTEAIASVTAESFDEIVVLDNASSPPIRPVAGTRHLRSEVNLGVTAARNQLAAEANGDVLVFLDDDAVFVSSVADVVRDWFDNERQLGASAFQIRRRDGHIEPSEWPFRGPPGEVGVARASAYFVGGACAVRRSAMSDVGGYDERFFYSTEEIDLSFRLLGDGWTIAYQPEIVVEHRPASSGRTVQPKVPGLRLRNRVLLVRRHLPVPVAGIHLAAWTLRTFLEARRARGLRLWWDTAREGWQLPVERQPLSWRVLRNAHRNGGRVLW
jgi:GT2 family glycosyltransferase